jgi:anti-anti-sigma factor
VSKLHVQGRNGTGDVLLVVVGSVDIATAPELERALARTLSEPAERLVIDLRRVDFMDASGVSLLLRQERRARAAGAALIVVKGPPAVQRLFQLGSRRAPAGGGRAAGEVRGREAPAASVRLDPHGQRRLV